MKNNFYKVLSTLLTLAIMLSVCVCAIGTVSAATATYYVSAAGLDTNTGTSAGTAVLTVARAIEIANETYGSGDTVTVKVTGDSVDLGTIPEYAFDLVVEGIDNTQSKLSSESSKPIIANNENGTTRFKNVQFISTKSYASFLMNSSKNVIFESTVSGFTATKYAAFGSYNDGQAAKTVAGQNIEFYNSVGIVFVGNGDSGWQRRTITEDLNITIAGGGSPNFYFNPSSNSSVTYQKNLNINVKKANSVSFTNNGTVTVNGAVQIINSTSSSVSAENSVLSAISGDKYVITNITGNADIIEFTETAGKFKVDTSATDYKIIATDKDGNIVEVDENGYLNLTTPGDYELSLHREPIKGVYYVSAEKGSQFTGEGTKANPYKFVCNAISKAIEDGYTSKDTVIVKLMDQKTIQWGETTTTPAHPFKLIVESDDRNNYSKVNIMHGTYLGGVTELKYGAYQINNTYSQLRINNYDFIIGDGANFNCLYYTFGDNSTSNTVAGHNVVFKNDISSPNIYLSNILHSNSKKYSGDVNVTVDNPFAAPVLRLSGQDGVVYYNANVNLLIKDATRISFGSQNKGKNVCNGAIQLIINSKTVVDPDGIEYLNTTCNPAGGFFYLVNDSEFKDLLTVTKTAGKYAVDTDKYDVIASDGKNQIKAKDGFLTLTAGNYTITATQIKEDVVPVITDKLENATINLWEQANGELNIDNDQSVATIDFGNKTYQDVKINVINAKKITFKGTPVIKGSLHIALNKATTVENKTVINAITAADGKWYIINDSGDKISFGDEVGEVLYNATGKELEAVSGSISIAPKFQNFLLNQGEYTIRVKGKTADKYSDFIEYRGNGLANTYAKLNNNKKLNVVYFGGSVTNGTGASSPNTTSWRGLIGQWLKNTYKDAEINNINAAIGATGTTFGSYRLNRYVIEQKPDLLFIEFSVNDFYDLHYTDKNYVERSKMQLETIIRQVRAELPECDIVVLHTLEKSQIAGARYGGLYAEAEAHHDIAVHYNIPTINLGAVLANALPDDWESAWSEYVTDLVHPTDKGYEVYYNAIKEYMSNCLLHTKQTGKISKHAIPVMASSRLLNGNIQYIDADRALLEKSEALGGSGFSYSAGEIYLKKDFGSIVSTAGDDSVFAMEFTGTELTMAISSSSRNLGGFKVKVDNGNYQDVASINVTPRFVATGLTPGKHTVYIKPVSSSSGTAALHIVGFYTRDESKATVKCTSHSFGDYASDENATCKADGTKTAYCTKCFTTKTVSDAGTKLSHVFENYVSDNNATCQENGTETAECAYGCGETDTRVDQDSIVDHKFENYVPNGDATCQKNETETAECEFGCGETDTRDIPNSKVSHKYSDDLDVSCDYGCGFERTFGAQLIVEGGVTYYYYDGVKSTATGIVDYEGKKMYINKGRFLGATGLVTIDGKKMYIRNGYFLGASGLVTIGGKKMYIRNGYFLGASGLVTISGKKMYINKGYFTGASGLVTISGKKMYINKGYFTGASGLVTIGGKKMYIRNGYFLGATGIVTINGKKHYINKGYFTGASGTVRVGGKTYKVVKGIVK